VNIDLMNNFIEQIAIDPNNSNKIYLVTLEGLYVSDEGGRKFSLLTDSFGSVSSVAISPINSNIILLGSEKGIVKSGDGGKTWKLVRSSNSNPTNWCIVFADPKNQVMSMQGMSIMDCLYHTIVGIASNPCLIDSNLKALKV